ncbi:hypothetical protein NDU88_008367 [Pleurodeles waltl]|uniref:Uncharacterized protein n=1 Tax=Pleurodeles waltl TaxID=8319 RepID=A0AAV7QSL2_PLEWA|nr:hypothetical protein NDU88_008367 [Pleurodeles waltl]
MSRGHFPEPGSRVAGQRPGYSGRPGKRRDCSAGRGGEKPDRNARRGGRQLTAKKRRGNADTEVGPSRRIFTERFAMPQCFRRAHTGSDPNQSLQRDEPTNDENEIATHHLLLQICASLQRFNGKLDTRTMRLDHIKAQSDKHDDCIEEVES